MTIGYVGFLFQAILVFSRESSLFGGLKHQNKVTLHWIFNTLGLLSILVGYAAIYYNKEENGKPHLTSYHSYIGRYFCYHKFNSISGIKELIYFKGIVTIVYTCIQFVAGHNLTVMNFLVRKFVNYNALALYHATSGTFLYVLACLSISMGINKMWVKDDTPFYIWYMYFAVTALLGLIVTNQVTEKYVRPKINPADMKVHLKNASIKEKKKK
jgi:hypothetical protein